MEFKVLFGLGFCCILSAYPNAVSTYPTTDEHRIPIHSNGVERSGNGYPLYRNLVLCLVKSRDERFAWYYRYSTYGSDFCRNRFWWSYHRLGDLSGAMAKPERYFDVLRSGRFYKWNEHIWNSPDQCNASLFENRLRIFVLAYYSDTHFCTNTPLRTIQL